MSQPNRTEKANKKNISPFDVATAVQKIRKIGFRSWLIHELTAAFYEARKHKIKTFNEHAFEVNWQENIARLADAVINRTYAPSGSVSFIIYEPMVREIFAAPFVDRVIHHFLYNVCAYWWDCHLIYDSYSCRVGKGTLFGIRRIQHMMRQATVNGTEKAYIIKNDIKGYFMSLPRKEVCEHMQWGLRQQFSGKLSTAETRQIYDLCKFLWQQILLDDPIRKSHRRGPLSNWDDLPPEKSLYNRDPGDGLVIGNQTSQLASNSYLDQLDRYVKYELGYRWYGRYVDDFVRIIKESDLKKALGDTHLIRDFLMYELRLTLHPKKYYVQPVDKGVTFLGARIYPHCLIPSNRLQGKFNQAVRNFVATKGANQDVNDTFISYLGLLKHLDAEPFVHKIFDRYSLDFKLYLESKASDRRSFDDIIVTLASELNKPNTDLGQQA